MTSIFNDSPINVIVLLDYKGRFGSKHDAIPYNSGLDLQSFKNKLSEKGISAEFRFFHDLDFRDPENSRRIFIHDSIEDTEYRYKSFMEDCIKALELSGAKVIPGYDYIKAHNNKIFMELLRDISNMNSIKNIRSAYYGTYEDFFKNNPCDELPLVIKGAQDAQSRQVKLGRSKNLVRKFIKKISRSKSLKSELIEQVRVLKYPKYIKESKYRNKFITQNFIDGLSNDWKILIFKNKYYILSRGVRRGDFRASGSKYNYLFGSMANPPHGIFDYAKSIYDFFQVPYLSLDIAEKDSEFFLIEFQFVSFGSSTHCKSDCYYTIKDTEWAQVSEYIPLENLYADSLSENIIRKYLGK